MDDLISRQAAIDKMQMFIDSLDKEATAYKSLMVAFNRCIIELKRMPSAQPEIIACGSGELVQESGGLVKDLVNDCISRQQAIGALNDEYHGMISDESMKIYQIINWISALPSAQPERKKGEWLVDEDGNMECPFCGNTCGFGNYCNECGADLRGE